MSAPVRIAVEGCGHGTLHSIYASVEESCRVKGWEGVDLLIIGGDFQAVRNQHDLNVTAMPVRFRQMADFHEYYSGSRVAPCLTVFVGGNHEASNHLFELYYGGWVAPNIYYMGAAGVLRLGPLRLAGLSGIWKGYDYRKSHFERLPYNKDDINSIYHVRELDVRKLLSLRTQVDIGISHDWPQGVEWLGDHELLFSWKDLFKADAEDGRLGSIAARQCLQRLRPPHWFSAHLHIKYAAVVKHPDYQDMLVPGPLSSRTRLIREEDLQQVSAWGEFHAQAQKADAEENERVWKEQKMAKEEEQKSGIRNAPKYTFNETFKQVKTDDNLGRAVTSVITEYRQQEDVPRIQSFDGCIESKPGALKRRRQASNSDALDEDTDGEHEHPTFLSSVDRTETLDTDATVVAVSPNKHPDTIGLDLSSDEEPPRLPPLASQSMSFNLDGTAANTISLAALPTKNPDAIELDLSDDEPEDEVKRTSTRAVPAPPTQNGADKARQHQVYTSLSSDPDEEGGMALNPAASSFRQMASMASILKDDPQVTVSRTTSQNSMEDLDLSKAPSETNGHRDDENAISDEMRAKLAELDPSFAKQKLVETLAVLPFPEEISNTATRFLALDKCEQNRQFLQLLEIEAMSEQLPNASHKRPLKLHYDPEWLAILRVFAPELQLGGDSNDGAPKHRGDTYYRERILEEEKYIQKHVVEAGSIEVPENFAVTAPIYDPGLKVDSRDMPREVTNPQTSAFCNMIGIENPFDITEEERDTRIARGTRPEKPRFGGGRGRGRGAFNRGGRGGFNNHGGGGYSSVRGGRGRGRGRGW